MKNLIFILTMVGALMAQDNFIGDVFEKGSVNYGDRTIQAIGIGFIPENVINAGQARRSAMRIAKQDALRQLIEIVNGVNVTSETTASGAMFDDVIKTQVQGAIRGARQIGEVKYLSDTSVEITYEVKMADISRVLLPPAENTESLTSNDGNTNFKVNSTGITGIIIDGTGLGLKPAISPKIINDSGDVVYGPGQYTRDFAAANGVVGYARSMDKAKNDSRVQGNPLVIKALSATGSSAADLVISNIDAEKVSKANADSGLLSNCRVIFLLDE